MVNLKATMKENGNDPVKEALKSQLEVVGEIYIDFKRKRGIFPKETGFILPRVTSEALSQILPDIKPILAHANPIEALKGTELSLNELALQFARELEKYGQNFRMGVGFASLVFKKLNEVGYNFPPVQDQVINSFKENYQEALAKYATARGLAVDSQEARSGLLKGFLLFGFLFDGIYTEENPELIELFRNFGSSRPFAKEGCILVYELKTAQHRNLQKERSNN